MTLTVFMLDIANALPFHITIITNKLDDKNRSNNSIYIYCIIEIIVTKELPNRKLCRACLCAALKHHWHVHIPAI